MRDTVKCFGKVDEDCLRDLTVVVGLRLDYPLSILVMHERPGRKPFCERDTRLFHCRCWSIFSLMTLSKILQGIEVRLMGL